MNALTVLSVAALVACGSAQILTHNGAFGFHGLLGGYNGYNGLLPYAYPGVLPASSPLAFNTPVAKSVAPAPVTYNVAPVAPVAAVAPVAPVAPIQSQYHAQDEIGQYSFGYAGGPSSRAEFRDAFGIVRGSYNYIDSEGKLQTQHYVADALGFRVSGTNLPVAPDAPQAAPLALPGPNPAPVEYTPEVAAARAAHQRAYDEAAAAAPDTRKKRSVLDSPALGVSSPLRFSYGFSTPLHYAHAPALSSPLVYGAAHPALTTYTASHLPATHLPTTYAAHSGAALHDAELLRVVHNPSHATSYRVLN